MKNRIRPSLNQSLRLLVAIDAAMTKGSFTVAEFAAEHGLKPGIVRSHAAALRSIRPGSSPAFTDSARRALRRPGPSTESATNESVGRPRKPFGEVRDHQRTILFALRDLGAVDDAHAVNTRELSVQTGLTMPQIRQGLGPVLPGGWVDDHRKRRERSDSDRAVGYRSLLSHGFVEVSESGWSFFITALGLAEL